MSVDLLYELQQETRRLFIAGSALAAGDLRLSKLSPSLRKLGESAPVFKRLADSVDELLAANREESSAKLLELGTLLSAVLYTQGKTETSGESEPIPGSRNGLKTDVSYRKLQPFIEALTSKGQGRLEQLHASYEDGSFLDLRALPAVCAALDDSYSEIPEFVQEKLIPAFGFDAVSVLRSQFNLQGGKGDGRRLLLMHRQLQGDLSDLIAEAATNGSPEVKIAAISILGQYPDQEFLLLDLSLEKRKEVRTAAYFSLAKLGTEAAIQRLYEAVTSKDREIAVEPVRRNGSAELLGRIVKHGEEALERFIVEEGKEKNEAAEQIRIVILSLEGSGDRMAAESYPFLHKLLTTHAYLIQETERTQEAAAELLLDLERAEANQFLIELGDRGKGPFLRYAFQAAYKRFSPADLYHRYSPLMNSAKSQASKELLRAISGIAGSQSNEDEERGGAGSIPEAVWDPRWVHLFIRLNQTELVCLFAQKADREITHYLESKLQNANLNSYDAQQILLAMFRIRYKEAPELFLTLLEKSSSRSIYYLNWQLERLVASLPKASVPRLRASTEKLAYESVRNQINAIIDELENKPDTVQEENGRSLWGWIKNKMS